MSLLDELGWFRSPSGLLALVASALLAVSFVDGRHQTVTGIAASGLLLAFLAYRFGREQRWTQARLAEHDSAIQRQIQQMDARIDSTFSSIDATDGSIAGLGDELARLQSTVAAADDPVGDESNTGS